MIIAAPPAIKACATYEVAKLPGLTNKANSPNCRWQVSWSDKVNGGDNAFVIDRRSGLAIYHFEMAHTARVYWQRDGRSLIVNLDPGPGEDGTALVISLTAIRSKPIDLSLEVLPNVYRRSQFSHTDTTSWISYITTRKDEWIVSAQLETTPGGLPGKESACYLYAVKSFKPTQIRLVGVHTDCTESS